MNTPRWLPIIVVVFLFGVAFFIIICLALSLIPLYITNQSVEKSSTTDLGLYFSWIRDFFSIHMSFSVYTVDNLAFSITGNRQKRSRIIRDKDSFPAPTSIMIISIQEQVRLDSLFDHHRQTSLSSSSVIISFVKSMVM